MFELIHYMYHICMKLLFVFFFH